MKSCFACSVLSYRYTHRFNVFMILFVLQWDAFSFPELQNFLRILQREEEDHVRQIIRRYTLARDKMKEAMKNFSTPGWMNLCLYLTNKRDQGGNTAYYCLSPKSVWKSPSSYCGHNEGWKWKWNAVSERRDACVWSMTVECDFTLEEMLRS